MVEPPLSNTPRYCVRLDHVGLEEFPWLVNICPAVPKLDVPVMLVFKPMEPVALMTWADWPDVPQDK